MNDKTKKIIPKRKANIPDSSLQLLIQVYYFPIYVQSETFGRQMALLVTIVRDCKLVFVSNVVKPPLC